MQIRPRSNAALSLHKVASLNEGTSVSDRLGFRPGLQEALVELFFKKRLSEEESLLQENQVFLDRARESSAALAEQVSRGGVLGRQI